MSTINSIMFFKIGILIHCYAYKAPITFCTKKKKKLPLLSENIFFIHILKFELILLDRKEIIYNILK